MGVDVKIGDEFITLASFGSYSEFIKAIPEDSELLNYPLFDGSLPITEKEKIIKLLMEVKHPIAEDLIGILKPLLRIFTSFSHISWIICTLHFRNESCLISSTL